MRGEQNPAAHNAALSYVVAGLTVAFTVEFFAGAVGGRCYYACSFGTGTHIAVIMIEGDQGSPSSKRKSSALFTSGMSRRNPIVS